MKKIFILTAAALLSLAGRSVAQSPSAISGSVKDNANKPLQSVTVSLLNAKDSSLVKTDVTDNKGDFEINTSKEGSFLLSYSSVGYDQQYSETFEKKPGQQVAMKPVALLQVNGKLKEVTIVAKKPMIEVKADKTVFNVEASINAQGSNALELLQKSPGIQVDNNDNISMKGKTGVKVYIDGKMMQLDTKDLAAYLKSINSNDIEAIEMISNPSAKYDASGNAGVINIRLKKNKRIGTNGSVNAGFVQGVTPKGNGSINLNYRDKKVNVFGNAGTNIGRYENELNLYRIQKDTLYDQKSVMQSNDKSMNVKAGADFFIDKKNTIGVMGTTNYSDNEWNSKGNTAISYNPTGTFIKKLQALNTVPGNRTNANFNLNYRYADTAGTEVNFDADYGLFRGKGRSYQPNNYYGNSSNLLYSITNRNYTPTNIDIYTAKVDVEHKLGKGKLGYGAKASIVRTTNTFDFFTDTAFDKPVQVKEKSNRFRYDEKVYAAYVNYQQQLNAKWSLQTGLRTEWTKSEGLLTRGDGIVQQDNNVKRSYVNLFPSAALTWNISQKHSLNLTYSRRIDRPTYQDLNPFENKLDELTYEKGNAFLRPQYTDNVELTHTFMGFLNTTVGYSHVSDYATQVTDTTGNATFVQQQNLATQQILSFNIGSPTPIKQWWNGYANFWFNYQLFNGKIGENKVSEKIPMYGAYLQQSFTLGKDYTAEISGWLNGPGVWGGTWKTSAQGSVDIGLQKQFLQKRASIKLAATDIFHTAPWKATNDFGGLYIKGGGNWESQTFRLSFSLRFGSNQINSSRERKTGLESESKRIKGAN
ncbi:MAG: TonB-dependent receptor [Chitinophagaceae bacterium]|nr:TonB-dependent receptor [Chitinophagaceae bacterium]